MDAAGIVGNRAMECDLAAREEQVEALEHNGLRVWHLALSWNELELSWIELVRLGDDSGDTKAVGVMR